MNDNNMNTGSGFNMKKYGTVIAIVVIVVLAGLSGFLFKKYHDSQNKVKQLQQDPNAAAKQAVSDLVSKVGKLAVLPTDETPTIATVTDPSKLKDQAFFTNAKTGDKVLIYTNAKKAFLYDPSTNKIVEIAPITIGDATGTTAAPAAATPAPAAKK